MAELAVIMTMISVTSTAASVLGIIKRRCGASQTMKELTSNCAELVDKIQTLLKTLERDSQVLCDARRISTALRLRREEFDAILKKLDKFKQLTKRTHPVDRTEKFIKAQGWAKRMEAVYNNLVHLRNGIENIVSNWDAAQFLATKFDEVVTIDVTKRNESVRCKHHTQSEMKGSITVNSVDRILTTMVKLTDANKKALNLYGNLDELSLPDALYEASIQVAGIDETCSFQLLQHSAELLHPDANYDMGVRFLLGEGVTENGELAVSHFQVASSRGNRYSLIFLMSYYFYQNDLESLVKYYRIASAISVGKAHWIELVQCAILHRFESSRLAQPFTGADQSDCALQQSICHFFGVGVPRSTQKAVDALRTFDSGDYFLDFVSDSSNRFHISGLYYYWYHLLHDFTDNSFTTAIRNYADYLFKANQFIPFLLISYNDRIYSVRKWKRYALQAASRGCVEVHIFLAEYYSLDGHRNELEMKRHLRIAADAGRWDAQAACRRLFGGGASVPKKLCLAEERRDDHQRKESNRSCTKQTEKKSEESPKERYARVPRASKKRDVGKK